MLFKERCAHISVRLSGSLGMLSMKYFSAQRYCEVPRSFLTEFSGPRRVDVDLELHVEL